MGVNQLDGSGMTEVVDEQEISKIMGQFRLQLGVLLKPLMKYGQSEYVVSAMMEVEKLAWQMHWKLEGIDIPFEVEDIHW